jgi:hypothetical protein
VRLIHKQLCAFLYFERILFYFAKQRGEGTPGVRSEGKRGEVWFFGVGRKVRI